jgi:hypothetical protein
MALLLALLIPVAVALVAAAGLFGGRAARPMLIASFVLAVFAICLVLVDHVS